MKLISMTDFVLEQNKLPFYYYDALWTKVINYANFLKQPLELCMFVPCDEDGNVLEEPRPQEGDNGNWNYQARFNQYQQAKERVLFEGFEFCESQSKGTNLRLKLFVSPYADSGRLYLTKKKENIYHSWFQLFTIEDLIQCELQLTPTAIKQIGL